MNKRLTISGITGAAVLILVAGNSSAVDQAAAAANLAEIAALSVQSKAYVAGDALKGNLDTVSESGKRSDAVDAAMAQGQEAYAAMERAISNGDEDAAQTAFNALQASKLKALDALNGVIPQQVAQNNSQWEESQQNTGGGPGNINNPPNIYENPSQTAGMRAFYQGLWGNFWTSGHVSGHRGEKDATQE